MLGLICVYSSYQTFNWNACYIGIKRLTFMFTFLLYKSYAKSTSVKPLTFKVSLYIQLKVASSNDVINSHQVSLNWPVTSTCLCWFRFTPSSQITRSSENKIISACQIILMNDSCSQGLLFTQVNTADVYSELYLFLRSCVILRCWHDQRLSN